MLDGSAGSKGVGVSTLSIQAAGSGWFRCSMTFNNMDVNQLGVCIVTSSSAGRRQANTSQYFLYVAALQIELGSATTSYIPTTNAEATRAANVV